MTTSPCSCLGTSGAYVGVEDRLQGDQEERDHGQAPEESRLDPNVIQNHAVTARKLASGAAAPTLQPGPVAGRRLGPRWRVLLDRYEASIWDAQGRRTSTQIEEIFPARPEPGRDWAGPEDLRPLGSGGLPSNGSGPGSRRRWLANSGKRLPDDAEADRGHRHTRPGRPATWVVPPSWPAPGKRRLCLRVHTTWSPNFWEWVAEWLPRRTVRPDG